MPMALERHKEDSKRGKRRTDRVHKSIGSREKGSKRGKSANHGRDLCGSGATEGLQCDRMATLHVCALSFSVIIKDMKT